MDPATITALVNWGAAGAVIVVVSMFLKNIEKRDADWQAFFTTLNSSNSADTKQNTQILREVADEIKNLTASMVAHDNKVEDRVRAIQSGTRTTKRLSDKKE